MNITQTRFSVTLPVDETVEETAIDGIKITLFWWCLGNSFRVIGYGDDYDIAKEDAENKFTQVMNNLLKINY